MAQHASKRTMAHYNQSTIKQDKGKCEIVVELRIFHSLHEAQIIIEIWMNH